jgi:ribosomal-protein-alanine N-acetyltransferase
MVAVSQQARAARPAEGEYNRNVRPAVHADQQQIASLLYFEDHVHRHLDWRAPLDWLGSSHYWVLEEDEHILAALACPQDPPGIAWVRLFTHASPLTGLETWSPLWDAVRAEIVSAGGATVAAIALHTWFETILRSSGFELHQQIVLLEWKDRPLPAHQPPSGIIIRRMQAGDLSFVVDTDIAAFVPLWCNSLDAFNRAFTQAVYASVAEDEHGGIVGYQLSTGNPYGAHLARLAVRPEAQGRGIGAALVSNLILRLNQRKPARLTVNTQDDNISSLALYEKIGFIRTGETFPVFTCQVQEA